ncbi:hypothetical protein [Planctomicrobium piriforme]|nr:hypothetical protein [Planctomicrobium piriforme]
MTAEFIDRELEPSPGPGSDGFILLTASFTAFLLDLSVLGTLAYIETDYFGGTGSQGAAVYSNGKPLMQSEGSELADPINKALELIGVRSEGSDRFDALGLGNFRSNDAIFEAIAQAKK